jgi:hypothetical protein
LIAPLFGWLADRHRRWMLIGGAVLDEDARLFRRLQAALIETTSLSMEKLTS